MSRLLCCLLLLVTPALAQDPVEATPPPPAPLPPPPPPPPAESTFYHAYYLYRGERRYEQALQLYRDFLAAAPDHRYAPRAARDLLQILARTGRTEEAARARHRYAAVLGRGDGDGPESRPAPKPPPRGGPPPDRTAGPLTDAERQSLRARVGGLRAELESARGEQDDRRVRRLERQIARSEHALETGERPPSRGERHGGRGHMTLRFADMSDGEIERRLARFERFRRMVEERLKQAGEKDRAEQVATKWKSMRDLLDAGKKKEAQKVWDELAAQLFRRH